jgi:hypothetical protein
MPIHSTLWFVFGGHRCRDVEKIGYFDKTSARLGGLPIFAAQVKVAIAQTSTPSHGAAVAGALLIAIGVRMLR